MALKTDLLQTSFLKATPEDYWHYMMKERFNEATYTSDKIQKMEEQIRAKMGSNSYETPRDHRWMPLHVAAIAGNRVGILFLKARGVSLEPRDEYGKRPVDYCTSDELKILFACPQAIEDKKVSIHSARFQYRAPSDFGLHIVELLFAMPNDNSPQMKKAYRENGLKIDHFVSNLRRIADIEGFRLRLSTRQYCNRDHWIRLLDGMVVLPSNSPNVHEAVERAQSLAFLKQNRASYLTDHVHFFNKAGATDIEAPKAIDDFEMLVSRPPPVVRFYIEGGNHFLASNASGKVKLLLGAELFPIILNQCRLDKMFEDPMITFDSAAKRIIPNLSLNEIRESLEEMHAQGLLPDIGGQRFFPEKVVEQIVTAHVTDPTRPYHAIARELGYLKPLVLTDKELESSRLMVARYHAQKKIVLELLAKTFFGDAPDLSKDDIVSIPQAGYHLDTFARPGPNGTMFLQDYRCCVSTLEEMQRGAKELGLTGKDLEMIETRYLPTAKKLHSELGPLLQEAWQTLVKAGFVVIPAPAVFYDVAPSRLLSPNDREKAVTFNLNFINSIAGWSAKNDQYYYIAAGAEVGDRLGAAFMETYRRFLDSHQKGIHVYYIGHDPKDLSKFAEAMRWLNRLGSQAGPHCFSFELQTKPHRS